MLRLAAHDLKNPLTAVRVLGEMLLEDATDATRTDLRDLVEAVDLASAHADLLSDLGRAEAGEAGLKGDASCDLGRVAREIAERPAFAPAVELAVEAPARVVGDEGGVGRVLASVLLNGRRMLGPGARALARVTGSVFEVRHPGLALAPEHRLALLDLYGGAVLKAHKVRASPLGLGLARHALEGVGGRVALEARPDGLIARLEFAPVRPGAHFRRSPE